MNHRTQTYLAVLQVMTVIAGTLLVGTMLQLFERLQVTGAGHRSDLDLARWLAHQGLWLLALPLAWVLAIWYGQRANRPWATRRSVTVTGVLLLGLLTALYFVAIFRATQPLAIPLGVLTEFAG